MCDAQKWSTIEPDWICKIRRSLGLQKKQLWREKYKSKRGHKTYVTQLFEQIRVLLEDKERFDELGLLTLKVCLERKVRVIADLDSKILDKLENEEETKNEIMQADEFQNEIRINIMQIERDC